MHSQFSWGGVVPLPKVGFSIEDQRQTHWSLELFISPESKEQKKKKMTGLLANQNLKCYDWIQFVIEW